MLRNRYYPLSLSLLVAVLLWALPQPTTAQTRIGYYDMSLGAGNPIQVPAITSLGHTPVDMTDLSTTDFDNADIDVLVVQNPSNGGYGAEYTSRLADIEAWVAAGGVLIMHDRRVTEAATMLPGGSGFSLFRDFSDDADIDVRDNSTLVTNGPAGVIDNTSLDGGTSSTHGFAVVGTLPGSGVFILSRSDPDEIVTFAYLFGSGCVIYSSIPLDFYLAGFGPNPPRDNFTLIYTPNVIAYAVSKTAADLALAKTLDVGEGKTGSYHLTVTNDGPGDTEGVEVTDFLPDFLTVTGWTATQGTFDPDTGLWVVDSLDVDAVAELWFDVTFDAQGIYTNTAEITASDKSDPNTDNNTAEVSVLVLADRVEPDFVSGLGPGQVVERDPFRFRADLSLTKTVDNAAPAVGTDVTYTLTVLNGGPQTTANVEATDHLPDCLDFVSATASQGDYDPNTGVWDIDNLAVGQSVTLQITATVTADCSGEVVNTAEITGSSLPDPDHIFNIFEEPPVDDGIDSAAFTVSSAFARASSWLTGAELALGGAYPNPFNPEAVIPYALPESGYVRIRVYDMLGREVARLVDGEVSAGVHEVTLRAEALPTGVYLVRMEAQGQVQVQRVTLMK
ncbi:MAG: T9SS type A sorting domain-containing protein [Rhodothermales bacterium]